MNQEIQIYHDTLENPSKTICEALYTEISDHLPEAESKIWHKHPVWFLDGNPIVGYHQLKGGIRLLFWSGQSFEETNLMPEGKFKAAETYYSTADQIDSDDLKRWLQKSRSVQWDYKNIVRRKGQLVRLR